LDISPDGSWVTTSSRNARSVRVWDVAAEQLVLTVPVGLLPRGHFSNDGRWLAVTSDKFELREVSSWKQVSLPFGEHRPILGAAAFSPDSRILAIVADRFAVHLFDLHRMTFIGVLRRPGDAHIRTLTFSSDGSKLAATGAEARVAVWDLHKLQRRLAEFGVPWEDGEGPAPAPHQEPAG
jgi:WD40 repeat protein